MSRFFRKYSVLFLFVSLFSVEGNGQVLDNAIINLNPGGVIYDVVADPYHDCYIIVGNFTSVNGFAVSNIAFLNRSDLSVNTNDTLNSINSINGEIRTVELYMSETFSYFTYRLYLGGNFTTVQTNGDLAVTRRGFVELLSQKSKLLPLTETAFSVTSWNIQIDYAGEASGVNDIYRKGDTLILAGNFQFLASGQTYQLLYNVIGFRAAAHTWISSIFNNDGEIPDVEYNCSACTVYSITRFGNNYYLAGEDNVGAGGNGFLRKYTLSGNYISTYIPALCGVGGPVYSVNEVISGNDSLLISNSKYAGSVYVYSHSTTGATTLSDPCGFSVFGSSGSSSQFVSTYSNSTITLTYGSIKFYEMGGVYPVPMTSSVSTNTTIFNSSLGGLAFADTYAGHAYNKLQICENVLFVTGNSLNNIGGNPRIGLAAICLEPNNPKPFAIADSSVCQSDLQTYTVPIVPYADGYRWQYTGSGADFGNDGSVDVGPIDYDLLTANSISIKFLSNATSGQLKVTPYSYCNGTTKLFSNTITTSITVSSAPNSIAGTDTSITCYHNAIQLYGYSDSTNIDTFLWDYPGSLFDTLGQFETVTSAGNYIFKVTNTNGCSTFDTVTVSLNKTKPNATSPAPPYEINCANPIVDFLGTTSSPNTITEWYDGFGTYPNPISVSIEGAYYFKVIDTLNGCDSVTSIYVSQNVTPPDIAIVGYPTIGLPLETLSCDLDTLNLVCTSSTPNSTASWINADTTLFYGDAITISDDGMYHLFATNNTNGCTISLNIYIAEDYTLHQLTSPPDGLLNCSTDSLILNGSSTGAGAVLEWTGSTISPSTNPLTVYDPGWYYLSAENLTNGCKTIDSVLVSQDNSITVFAGNDTLVCNSATVPVNATYAGTISGINYLWSNGATNANTSYTAGTQPYAVVQITGDGGCVGTDTVHMNLPPTPVVNFEGFKPCDDGPSGQIVATPVSGIEPFTYSIDNGLNYQSSSVFNGLYIGDYPILVRDSVSCEYNFMATIDENSSLPSPAFLFSTYNFETDTVVIIDVSNPPTDSTFWLFPNELLVLDNNPLSPMILLPDTGTFQITMQAYYGNCLVELSKLIYASPFDSLAATQYNLNGIKSIELYPNPTTGNFTVEVEFYKSQRAALVVQDMLANTYVFEEYDESFIITQDIYLDGTVIDGTYVLKIVSEFDSASITFILAR